MGKDKIIVALDVSTAQKAVEMVRTLANEVGAFKVGLELINSTGNEIFDMLREAGANHVFYDCKLHDIPNTVAGAASAITSRDLWMFNVHCIGGLQMMKAAKDAAAQKAKEQGKVPPFILGVTVLTSISEEIMQNEMRIGGTLEEQVAHLAGLAKEAGLDGVVSSPHEIEIIREACGDDFLIVTPGVRPQGKEQQDQKRVTTPQEAVKKGADYIVIGRPITKALDPKTAAKAVAAELELI